MSTDDKLMKFAPEISEVLEAGRAAPSAHNTQPWKFRVRDRTIEIGWNRARELPAGDPESRYLFTGLGAAAESMAVAASGAGFEASVSLAPAPTPELAASVVISDTPGSQIDEDLLKALPQRGATRSPFTSEPVPGAMLDMLTSEAESIGCHMSFLTDNASVNRVAKIIGDATAKNFERWDVYEEFFSWVRLRRSDPNYYRDGLSLDSLAPNWLFRRVAPLLMPPSRMKIVARLRLHGLVANSQRDLARRCPVFGLLTAPGHTLADYFAGGRAMERMWLRATSLGLKLHPMTAAMDNEETRSDLATLFAAAPDAPMIVSFRLGFGPESPRSARLPVEELLSEPSE